MKIIHMNTYKGVFYLIGPFLVSNSVLSSLQKCSSAWVCCLTDWVQVLSTYCLCDLGQVSQYLTELQCLCFKFSSVTQSCPTATPWTSACKASLPSTISWSLLNLMAIEWCHSTISSSITLFSCLQSFPASGSFLMSWLFASGGQGIGASSASASVLPMNIQDWFPLGLTTWSPWSEHIHIHKATKKANYGIISRFSQGSPLPKEGKFEKCRSRAYT